MKWDRYLLLCTFLCLAFVQGAFAQDTIRVSSADGYLGLKAQLLEDPTSLQLINDVIASEGFSSPTQKVPNLGIGSSAHWMRLTVLNDTRESSVLLDIEHAEIEQIDLFLTIDQRTTRLATTGQNAPLTSRDLAQPEFVFNLPIPQGVAGDVYLRFKSDKQLQVPLRIHAPSKFAESRSMKNLLIGGYIGIMIVMGLYNLFVFFSIRDRSYLIYVIYIFFVSLTQLAFWGVGQYYFWHGSEWFSVKASIILTFATAVAASEFMKQFIDTKTHVPRLHRSIPYFYFAFAIVMAFYLVIAPTIGYMLAQLAAGCFATFMFITILKVRRQGSRQAGYFLIGWSVFLIGTMVFTLKDMGILPYNDITVFTMPVGSAIEVVLLSFGLADRINVLRREKELSQAESLRISKENEKIIREQNIILEDRVKERTHALQESNENLKLTQTQLVNAEKMASLGQLTAGIAHEINNPINFITSNIKPLRRNIGDIVEVMQAYRELKLEVSSPFLEELRRKEEQLGIQESIEELDEIINSIAEGSSRTAEIVRGLRNFSRLDESDLKESDLNEGIRNTITVLAPQFRDRVTIEMDLTEIPKVECFPGKVNQVFMNILTNAVQATLARPGDRERKVLIGSSRHEDHVIISIRDNGIGMTDEVKARIFDPFFTTKAVGEGTGLGMAIVYGIIEDHKGSIAITSTPGEGTEFRIALPIRHMQLNERRA